MLSFWGAGIAREPETQEHGIEKTMAWPVFVGSGPDPGGPSRNDTRFFQHPASTILASPAVTQGQQAPITRDGLTDAGEAQRMPHHRRGARNDGLAQILLEHLQYRQGRHP